ncbi:MAG: nucleotidyltransferase family protein [Clostridiales Family XIII bacterium]|jgi:mannose-1-phosphate guanylyltransferase|nr:nucleotidyltransferase family protein [Clostridiales Family XIII bacterium]
MKAFLLAAGYGTRLRPLTDRVAKCLVPINGVPLLGWWFQLLDSHGISSVLVNTHYLAGQVSGFVDRYNALNGFGAVVSHESRLLGSGGTVKKNRGFIGDDSEFLVCYADSLTDIDIGRMREFHASHDGALTMALFRAERPRQCGIAELDGEGRIVAFEEKPAEPKGNLANAGIYIADRSVFGCFPESEFSDFGKDVLPKLVGRMYGYEMSEYLIDIGTNENYRKALREWRHDYNKNPV